MGRHNYNQDDARGCDFHTMGAGYQERDVDRHTELSCGDHNPVAKRSGQGDVCRVPVA